MPKLSHELLTAKRESLKSGISTALIAQITSLPEGDGIHVSCSEISGDEVFAIDFGADCEIRDLGEHICAELGWKNFNFLSEDAARVSVRVPLKNFVSRQITVRQGWHTEEQAAGDCDVEMYMGIWTTNGGDAEKVTNLLNLKRVPKDYDEYIGMCKAGKFRSQ
mmetsp:Transcript_88751/g.249980  ORF Transcript_88751/g.249980 Transcript_88751/m.249980 type:complete len:164 (+) Transcript_88751:67-558(+)